MKTGAKVSNGTVGFLVKVVVASALLSLLLKYGGPLLPIAAPYTDRLNGLVTAIILLPSLVIGTALISLIKAQRLSD
ncbi:MAG: hypothetical protein DCF25_17540 [Leptolyngbya foveolarum]|uniref:Uncharacterized protein n=1 Tax=Leptolyngbya foveolarum TaxID=47253 RepID=A0A2W4TXW6_9CYAN|nr:MAG: hypothetical protein DCF25_17540 [Leptolyngbya foveolarum]